MLFCAELFNNYSILNLVFLGFLRIFKINKKYIYQYFATRFYNIYYIVIQLKIKGVMLKENNININKYL